MRRLSCAGTLRFVTNDNRLLLHVDVQNETMRYVKSLRLSVLFLETFNPLGVSRNSTGNRSDLT